MVCQYCGKELNGNKGCLCAHEAYCKDNPNKKVRGKRPASKKQLEHLEKIRKASLNKGGWKCKHCDCVLESRRLMLEHNRLKHPEFCNSGNKNHGGIRWSCRYCGEILSSRRQLQNHIKECKVAQFFKRDSLGRIIPPDAHNKAIETLKSRIQSGDLVIKGRKHTDIAKEKISIGRCNYLESHPNHGVKWFTVNGIKVQGTWEKRFAEYLVSKSIDFDRIKIKFLGSHTYTPDFHCIKENVFFEVKGFRRDRDIYKMHLVLKEHPDVSIKMIEKEQLDNLDKINIFDLPNFQDVYPLDSIDTTMFTNVWEQ